MEENTISPEFAFQTAAAQTVEALSTELASTKVPLPLPSQGESQANPRSTADNQPTRITPTEPLPSTSAEPLPTAKPCNRAFFVNDISVPDGTAFEANTNFTKTWRIKNNGSCTWSSGYKLVFESGNAMGGPPSVPLLSSVPPDGEIDISVDLISPAAPNTYQGNWKLQNASGVSFGTGVNANLPIWVKIKVRPFFAPPIYFVEPSVNISTSPTRHDGTCSVAIPLSDSIITSTVGE